LELRDTEEGIANCGVGAAVEEVMEVEDCVEGRAAEGDWRAVDALPRRGMLEEGEEEASSSDALECLHDEL
jgi:hypothetical protein